MRSGRWCRRVRLPHVWLALALCGGLAAADEEEAFSLESLGAIEEPAEEPQADVEPVSRSVWNRLTDNMRATLDLATRATVTTRSKWSYASFVGFDVYKVCSLPEGDWGTLILQGYLTRLDDALMRPPFFEGPDDWEFVWRIFNFNYTGLKKQYVNFRVGHYEIPFGLEQILNTNGTLRQLMHGRNIGVKADWGVSVNGTTPKWEYEVGLTRGTGNEWTDTGQPFLVAARVGTSRDENHWAGASVMYGEVLNPGAVALWRGGLVDAARGATVTNLVRRWRAGVDGLVRIGLFALLGEVAVGEDFEQAVVNALVELHYQSPDERWLVYGQVRAFFQDFENRGWDDMTNVTVGVRLSPDLHWAFSVQFDQNLSSFGPRRDGKLSVQVRYRF